MSSWTNIPAPARMEYLLQELSVKKQGKQKQQNKTKEPCDAAAVKVMYFSRQCGEMFIPFLSFLVAACF